MTEFGTFEQSAPTAVSLFSGLGGIDIGIHRAGIKTEVCVENAPETAKTLMVNSRHHSESSPDWARGKGRYPWRVISDDVREVDANDILETANCETGDIDLVVGGPPCQTFSRSNEGNRNGTDDSRGRLFEEFARIVQEIEPRAFIFENVRGLRSANDGEDIRLVEETLSGSRCPANYDGYLSDYGVESKVLNSADFGVPQTRTRLFILGLRSGKTPSFPNATHSESGSSNNLKDWNDAGHALSEFVIDQKVENDGGYINAVGGKHGHLLHRIPPGANYQHFSERRYDPDTSGYIERESEELDEKVFDWRSRHWNYLLKQEPERPAWTIQAKPGTYVGPFHWRSRKLTKLEQMRLMDLPLDYQIVGDSRTVQRQIGNAVPPRMAEVVAPHLLNQAGITTSRVSEPTTAEVDGGKTNVAQEGSEVPISAETEPWKLAFGLVSTLEQGNGVLIRADGSYIPSALDVTEIVNREVSHPISVKFDELVERTKNRKSHEISVVELVIDPI